jgi:hypothetical protein
LIFGRPPRIENAPRKELRVKRTYAINLVLGIRRILEKYLPRNLKLSEIKNNFNKNKLRKSAKNVIKRKVKEINNRKKITSASENFLKSLKLIRKYKKQIFSRIESIFNIS